MPREAKADAAEARAEERAQDRALSARAEAQPFRPSAGACRGCGKAAAAAPLPVAKVKASTTRLTRCRVTGSDPIPEEAHPGRYSSLSLDDATVLDMPGVLVLWSSGWPSSRAGRSAECDVARDRQSSIERTTPHQPKRRRRHHRAESQICSFIRRNYPGLTVPRATVS
mgnify:CR=1 FL=1